MQINQNPNTRVRVIPARKRTSRNAENPDGKKKRIGVYIRVSTESDMQASSFELQMSYFTDFVNSNPNWVLAGTYADHGISGTSTKNRIEFNRMIQDAKAGKLDYIITKSISRFARNTLDCLKFIRMLKEIDVGVWFQKENIDTLDSKSELVLSLISSLSQEEARQVSENTKWSIQRMFQAGKFHCPTTYFLGYETDEDENIVINEEQAKIVRRIFDSFLEGKGTATIARELMKDKVLTARANKKWTGDAVYKILKNEKYMGHVLAQKTVTLDFLTHKRVRNTDIQPQYFIKNAIPPIISEEDWNVVQQELKRRNEMLRNPDKKYSMRFSGTATFSNKLFCGECGRPVVRRRLTSHSKDREKFHFTAWQCRVAAHLDPEFKGCHSKYVWEEDLEQAFMNVLIELKNNKDIAIKEVKKIIDESSITEAEEERLQELKVKIDKITDRISDLATQGNSRNDAIYDATMRHMIYEQEILQLEYDGLDENKQESRYLQKSFDELVHILEQIKEETDKFSNEIFIKTIEKSNYL